MVGDKAEPGAGGQSEQETVRGCDRLPVTGQDDLVVLMAGELTRTGVGRQAGGSGAERIQAGFWLHLNDS